MQTWWRNPSSKSDDLWTHAMCDFYLSRLSQRYVNTETVSLQNRFLEHLWSTWFEFVRFWTARKHLLYQASAEKSIPRWFSSFWVTTFTLVKHLWTQHTLLPYNVQAPFLVKVFEMSSRNPSVAGFAFWTIARASFSRTTLLNLGLREEVEDRK